MPKKASGENKPAAESGRRLRSVISPVTVVPRLAKALSDEDLLARNRQYIQNPKLLQNIIDLECHHPESTPEHTDFGELTVPAKTELGIFILSEFTGEKISAALPEVTPENVRGLVGNERLLDFESSDHQPLVFADYKWERAFDASLQLLDSIKHPISFVGDSAVNSYFELIALLATHCALPSVKNRIHVRAIDSGMATVAIAAPADNIPALLSFRSYDDPLKLDFFLLPVITKDHYRLVMIKIYRQQATFAAKLVIMDPLVDNVYAAGAYEVLRAIAERIRDSFVRAVAEWEEKTHTLPRLPVENIVISYINMGVYRQVPPSHWCGSYVMLFARHIIEAVPVAIRDEEMWFRSMTTAFEMYSGILLPLPKTTRRDGVVWQDAVLPTEEKVKLYRERTKKMKAPRKTAYQPLKRHFVPAITLPYLRSSLNLEPEKLPAVFRNLSRGWKGNDITVSSDSTGENSGVVTESLVENPAKSPPHTDEPAKTQEESGPERPESPAKTDESQLAKAGSPVKALEQTSLR